MRTPKHGISVILLLQSTLLQSLVFFKTGAADYIPPAKLDGFAYNSRSFNLDTIFIEAFYDPVCPDSRDSWPPLKQALHHYGSRVSFVVHLLPLPNTHSQYLRYELQECSIFIFIFGKARTGGVRYHDNAFVASRALHIVNGLNTSATFPLLEWFFKNQEKFYGAQTRNLSRASIVEEIVKFATKVVGNSYYSSIKNGFNDTKTDLATRVSFKYATSRGVYGTPFFYVNGFVLPDTGSAVDYNTWRKVIDPLIGAKKGVKNEESLHFFL